jgi:ABC-type branched-subunit amino acid transport system substrate-binding protein
MRRGYEMKKWLSAATSVVLCLALVIGVACGGGEEEEGIKEVKFGVGLPLSGIIGTIIGEPTGRGGEFARDKIGTFFVSGEEYRWKDIAEENNWTAAGGVASATKLIYQDGVKLMHQSGADAAKAAQPLCEEAGVLLDGSAGLGFLGPEYPHSIYMAPSYEMPFPVLFRWLAQEHPEIETVAIIRGDDLTGHGEAAAAEKAAEYYGFEVVAKEFIPAGTTEFYPLATRVVDKDPDFLVGNIFVLLPMREMGWDGLAGDSMWGEAAGEYAGWDNVQGQLIWLNMPFGDELPQAIKDYAADYEERYDEEYAGAQMWSLIINEVWTDMLRKAGTVDDVDQMLATIEAGTYFDTSLGPLRFMGEELVGIDHLLVWPIWILEIQGQEPQIVEWVDAEEVYELAVEILKD